MEKNNRIRERKKKREDIKKERKKRNVIQLFSLVSQEQTKVREKKSIV
jgi:hypothetical protein